MRTLQKVTKGRMEKNWEMVGVFRKNKRVGKSGKRGPERKMGSGGKNKAQKGRPAKSLSIPIHSSREKKNEMKKKEKKESSK